MVRQRVENCISPKKAHDLARSKTDSNKSAHTLRLDGRTRARCTHVTRSRVWMGVRGHEQQVPTLRQYISRSRGCDNAIECTIMAPPFSVPGR